MAYRNDFGPPTPTPSGGPPIQEVCPCAREIVGPRGDLPPDRVASWGAYRSALKDCLICKGTGYKQSPDDEVKYDPERKRLRIVRMTNVLLADLLSMDGTRRIKIEGLPADARIVGVNSEIYFHTDEVAIKVWSATFEKVPKGEVIPELKLKVSETRPSAIWRMTPDGTGCTSAVLREDEELGPRDRRTMPFEEMEANRLALDGAAGAALKDALAVLEAMNQERILAVIEGVTPPPDDATKVNFKEFL